MSKVTMTCMTTKQKFECEDPPVVILANGRYAYRVCCPWEGKNGKVLHAFKFCSAEAYRAFCARQEQQEAPEEPEKMSEEEQEEELEEP
jgi:hypothetical protein